MYVTDQSRLQCQKPPSPRATQSYWLVRRRSGFLLLPLSALESSQAEQMSAAQWTAGAQSEHSNEWYLNIGAVKAILRGTVQGGSLFGKRGAKIEDLRQKKLKYGLRARGEDL